MEQFEHGGNVYAHPGCLDFSANLNPAGIPDAAREALRQSVDAFASYPDPSCAELVQALAAFEGVPAARVVACAGATDAFARICQVLRPRSALVCAPCYSGYEQALVQSGARVDRYHLRASDGFEVTSELIGSIGPRVDVVFLANPNNPTGRCLRRDVLVALLEQARHRGVTVVLDECFIDLTRQKGSNDLLTVFDNLVLVKACTKTFSLAGLRLGYALCSSDWLADGLRAAGQPWAVSVPAQIAGAACLDDKVYLRRSLALIERERALLRAALETHGLLVIPGEANFLLFRGPKGLAESFLEQGILIRSCDNFRGLDACWYRIAVRAPEENARFIEVLGEVLP